MTLAHAVPARRLVVPVVSFGVLTVAVLLFADTLGSGLAAFTRLDASWVVLAVVAELAAVGATAVLQRRMLRVGGVLLAPVRAYRLALATTALNLTMPAGNAVSSAFAFARLRAWNVGTALAGFAIAASVGLGFFGFLLLSVSFGIVQGDSLVSLLASGLVGALVVVGVLAMRRRPEFPAAVVRTVVIRVNRLRRRAPSTGLAAVDTFFGDLHRLHPGRRDWLVGASAAALYWLADLSCLVACERALGLDVGLLATAAAYLAGMSIAGISPVPGGLGAVEAAMIVVLAQAELGHVAAVGLVIVYRTVSLGLVGVLGWTELLTTRLAAHRGAQVVA